jgi:hypothetical protein
VPRPAARQPLLLLLFAHARCVGRRFTLAPSFAIPGLAAIGPKTGQVMFTVAF